MYIFNKSDRPATDKLEPGLRDRTKNSNWITYSAVFLSIVSAFAVLFIASKNSPFYPFNDWVDIHAIFSVGSGIGHGLVPYKDLFEQKGPVLYFIFLVASVISNDTLYGVYILESIFFSIYLFFSYKILSLRQKNSTASLFLIPIVAAVSVATPNFAHGGSAEEFCLSFLSCSLYFFIRYFQAEEPKRKYFYAFIFGLFVVSVGLIKFNLLGFFIPIIFIIMVYEIGRKKYAFLFIEIVYFILGMAAIFVPVSFYFFSNNAFNEFINVYFIFNTTSYGTSQTVMEKIRFIVHDFMGLPFHRDFWLLILALGIGYLIIDRKMPMKWYVKFGIFLSFIVLLIGVDFHGMVFMYYHYILVPFMIFGFITILEIPFEKFPIKLASIWTKALGVCVVLVLAIFSVFLFSANAKSLITIDGVTYKFQTIKKEQLAQYVFASEIQKSSDKRLLNFGFLDGGFYFAAGQIPTERYFEHQNVDDAFYPDNLDSQISAIRNKEVNFVIIRLFKGQTVEQLPCFSVLTKSYSLKDQMTQTFEGFEFKYCLYIRNP